MVKTLKARGILIVCSLLLLSSFNIPVSASEHLGLANTIPTKQVSSEVLVKLSRFSYTTVSKKDIGKTLADFYQEKTPTYLDGSEDWKIYDVLDRNDQTGFYGVALHKEDIVIISYRGSEFGKKGLLDEKADLALSSGKIPEQYNDAITFFDQVIESTKNEPNKVIITGHSLGGWLAQMVALSRKETSSLDVTVTFNAPGIVKESDIIKEEWDAIQSGKYDQNIYQYIISNDVVGDEGYGIFDDHIGSTFILPNLEGKAVPHSIKLFHNQDYYNEAGYFISNDGSTDLRGLNLSNYSREIFDGGKGDEILYGFAGNDTYIFKAGYGKDIIMETTGTDRLSIYDIELKDVTLEKPEKSWDLILKANDDMVIIPYYFSHDEDYRVEQVIFNHGDVLDFEHETINGQASEALQQLNKLKRLGHNDSITITGEELIQRSWTYTGNVPMDKEWKVKFNTQMNDTTIHSNNVFIENANRKKLTTISLHLLSGGNVLSIQNSDLYQLGETYHLHIKQDVKDTYNQSLKEPIKMTFTVNKKKGWHPVLNDDLEEAMTEGSFPHVDVKSGDTKEFVLKKLGEPDKEEIFDFEHWQGSTLLYGNLSMSFDEHDILKEMSYTLEPNTNFKVNDVKALFKRSPSFDKKYMGIYQLEYYFGDYLLIFNTENFDKKGRVEGFGFRKLLKR